MMEPVEEEESKARGVVTAVLLEEEGVGEPVGWPRTLAMIFDCVVMTRSP